jgi:hypothetical protein
MIGTHLKARPTNYLATLMCVLIATVLLVFALITTPDATAPHLVMIAVWPICLAIAYWTHRRKLFLAELLEDGISTNVPDQEQVPYSSIYAVQAETPHQRYYPIHLHHSSGKLSIPTQNKVPGIELQRFFSSFVPQNKSQAMTGEMQAIYHKQVDKFGTDKVFVFTPRLDVIKGIRGSGGRAFAMGTMFTGLFWIIGGPVMSGFQQHFNGSAWSGAGFFFAFLGILLAGIFSNDRKLLGGQNEWKQSGLIISPVGLSIIQNKMRGEMKWNELKRLVFPVRRTSFQSSGSNRSGSIRLDFGGGSVDIFDIYCHPLDAVYERIKGYWQG